MTAQTNTTLLSHVDYQNLHQANLNDVWGYVDETGKEYAIVGTTKGTSILDVSNPTSPTEIFGLQDQLLFGEILVFTEITPM